MEEIQEDIRRLERDVRYQDPQNKDKSQISNRDLSENEYLRNVGPLGFMKSFTLMYREQLQYQSPPTLLGVVNGTLARVGKGNTLTCQKNVCYQKVLELSLNMTLVIISPGAPL